MIRRIEIRARGKGLHPVTGQVAAVVEDSGVAEGLCTGPGDMPAHVEAALTQTSLGIPVVAGRLAPRTWRRIYVWEHRRRPLRRGLVVRVGA